MSNKRVLAAFEFSALPHTVVLDGKNRVKLVISGYREDTIDQVENAIKKWGKK